ncbi:MAG: hypothetical protein ACPHYF_08980 [Akkermansiaceae bacterium]
MKTETTTILAAISYLIEKQKLEPVEAQRLINNTIKELNESRNNDK